MRSLAPLSLEQMNDAETADFGGAPLAVTATTVLDAEPAAVFEELRDPSLWFPLMRRSVWHTGATSGVGAEREVDIRLFGRFRERMLAWQPGERVAFTMIATTSPLVAQMAEDWRLQPHGDGTQLTWTVVAVPSALARPTRPAMRALLRAMFAVSRPGLARRAASYPRARNSA